ncbi:polyribonucleotide nucleotidyltransferase, partial [Klebsiella pneumoniae]|nr:polyribonucleotide nucleotidyltransferase [Klebsiella pneumoniae]
TDELAVSKLDLVVAGTKGAVLMVESEAQLLTEEQMLGAVVFGHEQQQIVIENINALAAEAGKPKWDWQPEPVNQTLRDRVAELSEKALGDAYRITEKQDRYAQVDIIKDATISALEAEFAARGEELTGELKHEISDILAAVEKSVVRTRVLNGEPRIDGREKDMVRALDVRTGVLPRT